LRDNIDVAGGWRRDRCCASGWTDSGTDLLEDRLQLIEGRRDEEIVSIIVLLVGIRL
jgi:hypothetical protein